MTLAEGKDMNAVKQKWSDVRLPVLTREARSFPFLLVFLPDVEGELGGVSDLLCITPDEVLIACLVSFQPRS
jgi:hypothetical protein